MVETISAGRLRRVTGAINNSETGEFSRRNRWRYCEEPHLNTDSLTLQSGHLDWCALIALHLARQDGTVNSDTQANLFLTRWLATAQKQRRFPREIAPDIEWLLKKSRTLGVNAKLSNKLDYLWRSCTGELSEQNDMFRLTYALETARDIGWIYTGY